MIIDTLDNIDTYKGVSPDIHAGLEWLKDVVSRGDIELGVYPINSAVKAIVSEYQTIEKFERGYEAHKHVIDIQYPIQGTERVKWSPISGMDVNIPYDEAKDRTFYKTPHVLGSHVDIGEGIFAIMFPQDGHSPQHFTQRAELIKKITIKISI